MVAVARQSHTAAACGGLGLCVGVCLVVTSIAACGGRSAHNQATTTSQHVAAFACDSTGPRAEINGTARAVGSVTGQIDDSQSNYRTITLSFSLEGDLDETPQREASIQFAAVFVTGTPDSERNQYVYLPPPFELDLSDPSLAYQGLGPAQHSKGMLLVWGVGCDARGNCQALYDGVWLSGYTPFRGQLAIDGQGPDQAQLCITAQPSSAGGAIKSLRLFVPQQPLKRGG